LRWLRVRIEGREADLFSHAMSGVLARGQFLRTGCEAGSRSVWIGVHHPLN
jgi:hypothetical protein